MAEKQTKWDTVKDNIKSVKVEIIIMNAAIIILGILMVCVPHKINSLICQGTGAALCIWGVVKIVKYFMERSKSDVGAFGSFGLVQGGAMLGFGIFFLVNPNFFVNVVDIAMAIILLVTAVIKLQYAFDFLKMESKKWWIQIIGSVIMAVLGILALTKPFGIADIIMIFIGCGLIFSGIWDLISVFRVSSIIKNTLNNAKKKTKMVNTTADDE